ncbi:hypothetical protein [Streptomyces stelliscabiei]|uniref:hypothetical protein n=1 Tax=Streptomyces stelliscabiei TaxID=146820 RepID=UPI002FF11015
MPAAVVVEDDAEAAVDLVIHLERLIGERRGVVVAVVVLADVEELRNGQATISCVRSSTIRPRQRSVAVVQAREYWAVLVYV